MTNKVNLKTLALSLYCRRYENKNIKTCKNDKILCQDYITKKKK